MTGWRIGYAYGPAEIIARMTRIQETQASCVSTPTQHAALAALTGPQQALTQMRAAYRSRRDLAVADARRLGLQVEPPTGAFYLWLTLPPEAGDSTTFALQLLSETGVAVAPGAAFGPAGEGHLRVSLAAAEADLRHGLKQIAGLLADHGQLTAVSTVDDLPPQPAAPAPDAPTPRRSRCCVADHH
jgi:aspartate/methionine/tyrosine aminotransferase